MPRVPAAPQTVVTESVAARPLRIPLQNVAGAGVDASGLAQGIMSGAEAIERGNLQLSQIRISDAETEILNRWNARLNEDEDAYFKLGGEDAVEGLDSYLKENDDIAKDVMGRLKTGRERRILTNALALRRMNNRTKMSLHSFDARQQWDRTTALANRQAQFEAALNDPSPENLRLSRERVIDETDAISKIDHLPQEAAELSARVAVSEMYTAVIRNLIAQGRPFDAEAMFERYEDQILGADQTALTEALSSATVAAESSALANAALQDSDSAEDQLKFVRAKFGKNPSAKQLAVIEKALSKVSTQRNQEETAQGIARSENYNFLGERVIAATNSGAQGIKIIEALEGAFPERFEGEVLSTSQRASLISLAGVGQPQVTSGEGMMAYLQIMELAATDPSVLATLDPADFLGTMAKTEFDKITKAINEAKGAGITSGTAAIASRQKTLNQNSRKHGFDLGAKELSATGLLIQRETQERLDEFIATQKRQPTEKEWLDIIDTMFIKVLFDETRPPIETDSVFAVPRAILRGLSGGPDEKFAFQVSVADIPPAQIKIVEADFRRQFHRNPLENELETHWIGLMSDPATRDILLGK